MRKFLFVMIAAVAIVFVTSIFSQEFTYVGAGKCKICHKSEKRGNQFGIWEQSSHSQSFTVLSSEKAKERAADASVNSKCLKCHSPLNEKAPELREEGIGCEVCHGPGSAYKNLSVMKSKEESVKNGLKAYDSPEFIKAHCLTCHQNAHDKPFDFNASWEKIKHPVPETE